MPEQQGEIFIHLVEGGQQPLAALPIERGNAAAQCLDRIFQIGLFTDQRGVFLPDLLGVLFGAQIDGAQGIALLPEPYDVCLHGDKARHDGRIQVKRRAQRFRRHIHIFFDSPGSGAACLGSGIGACLAARACLARVTSRTFRCALSLGCLAQGRLARRKRSARSSLPARSVAHLS